VDAPQESQPSSSKPRFVKANPPSEPRPVKGAFPHCAVHTTIHSFLPGAATILFLRGRLPGIPSGSGRLGAPLWARPAGPGRNNGVVYGLTAVPCARWDASRRFHPRVRTSIVTTSVTTSVTTEGSARSRPARWRPVGVTAESMAGDARDPQYYPRPSACPNCATVLRNRVFRTPPIPGRTVQPGRLATGFDKHPSGSLV
jgi:hypothetical protein